MKVDALEKYLPRVPDEVPGRDTKFSHPDEVPIVGLTQFEKDYGRATYHFYESDIKRLPAWKVMDVRVGGVTERVVLMRRDVAQTADKNLVRDDRQPVAPRMHHMYVQLDTSNIGHEQVPLPVLQTATTFMDIENKLSDYSAEAENRYRNIWGISRGYHQWSDEEGTHSDGQAFILVSQGYFSQLEIEQRFIDDLEKRYVPPTRDMIGVTCITALQERLAALNYAGLAKTSREAGALAIAQIFGFSSGDESFHASSYRGYNRIAYELAPVRTKKTVIQTAVEFDFPAHKLLKEPRRRIAEMMASGALTKGMMTEKTILRTLEQYEFIEPELAREVTDHHGDPEYIQRIKDWANVEAA